MRCRARRAGNTRTRQRLGREVGKNRGIVRNDDANPGQLVGWDGNGSAPCARCVGQEDNGVMYLKAMRTDSKAIAKQSAASSRRIGTGDSP